MHRLIKPLFWTFLFLVMMLVIDQALVQIPPAHPAHAVVCNFYRDFRGRVIDLAFGEKQTGPASIEAVIETQQKSPPAGSSPGAPAPASPGLKAGTGPTEPAAAKRYVYSDRQGELQFADSLEEVPAEFRSQAQPLAE